MIPNKSNFKFQELPPITGVKPYVIRFWETEFEDIAPVTSDSGQKIYARKDVEAIMKIKKLLFEQKFSIPEAKAHMKDSEMIAASLAPSEADRNSTSKSIIIDALDFIHEIKTKRNWT